MKENTNDLPDLKWKAAIHWESADNYKGITHGTVEAPTERQALIQCKAVIEDPASQKQIGIDKHKGIKFVTAEISLIEQPKKLV